MWDWTALAPVLYLPAFRTTMGLVRAKPLAALMNFFAFPIPSTYTMMLRVDGSVPRKSMRSPKSRSSMDPSDAKRLNPTWETVAQSRMADPRAPLCEMNAMDPGSGLSFRKVALRWAEGLAKPTQFGPRSLKPYLALMTLISCSSLTPSLPTSRKPAEIMTTPSTPAFPHSSAT